jgi:DNA-binding transcriptional LysR family regulator
MDGNDMNLKQLEVFVAVAETGSFSKGADISCITQSTVSQHISALEHQLGLRLLDRTGKGAFPTPAGKKLLKLARQVLADVERIHQELRQFKGVEDVSLNVGGSTIPGSYMIPDALPVLTRRFPRMAISLVEGDSQDILDKLAREEVEIGIVGATFPDKGFTFQPFATERLILVAGQQHPLTQAGPVSVARLAEADFIFREPGSGTGKTVGEALRAVGIDAGTLRMRARLGSNESVKHVVAAGLGISFVSELSVKKELERGELVRIELEGMEMSRTFYFAVRTGRELSPAARAFMEVMTELYSDT